MAPLTQALVEEEYSQEPKAPFTQVDHHALLKQKANGDITLDDEESLVSKWSMEIDSNALAADLVEDPIMSSNEVLLPIKSKAVKKVLHTTYSTSITATVDSKLPAHKKVKVEPPASMPRLYTCSKHGYAITKTSAYRTTDLPAVMQVDQRWVKKIIPTIMLWAGSYEDIWSIPDEVLLHHAQLVFNVVYNDLDIVIVHGGVIHSLCILEWHSNFGSTGLVIIMDFLARNSDLDPVELTKSLLVDWAFLFENPDSPSSLTAYRSPFILQLFGTAHLNAINGYVEVHSFNMHVLATSGMLRPLALSAAAIKRAVTMIAQKELKAQNVLSSTSRGRVSIKLPKILNKATGKETNVPFLFSAACWAKPTNSFIKSLLGKPTGYLEATIQMACATLNDITETPLGSVDEDEDEDEDDQALSPNQ
ncbi:hypothetical protein BDR07DRAFT_1381434 [Suillus spraguei]|nr:hypothetical protein BDR07DRAFT_1381434 [Suillus spraguei]